MATESPKPQRQPRLRASCDACGAAKLKCSRDQPKCIRCKNSNLECRYGVSRKKGRPHRDKTRSLPVQLPAVNEVLVPGRHDSSISTSTSLSDVDTTFSWDMAHGSHEQDLGGSNGLMVDTDTSLDPYASSLLDMASFKFGDWPLMGQLDEHSLSDQSPPFNVIPTPTSLDSDASSSSSPRPLGLLQQPSLVDRTSKTVQHDSGEQDCSREVHNILGRLSVESAGRSFAGQATASPCDGGSVPLDHVLHLNRTAVDCLARLLTCTCATTPNMVLLFAANMYRIMNWYQQVAASSMATSGGQGSQPAPCSWATPNLSTVSIAPVSMAIGSFSIDDKQVHIAMKARLVLSEMHRLGRLVKLFVASHGSSSAQSRAGDANASSGAKSLYHSFDSWLETEHSRIVQLLISQLREYDASDVPCF